MTTILTQSNVPIDLIKTEHFYKNALRLPNRRKKTWQNLKKSIQKVGLQNPVSLLYKDGSLYLLDGYLRLDALTFLGAKWVFAQIRLEVR